MADRIDLRKFCAGEDDIRSYCMNPFRYNQWTYATDGNILVRVECDENDELADVKGPSRKRLEEILAMHPSPTFAPLRVIIPDQEIIECEKCDGVGEYECAHCRRNGECEYCEGKGKIEVDTTIIIGGVHFGAQYIRKIAALPNVEIATNPAFSSPMPFRFEGGIGCLMPRRKEGKIDLGDIWKWEVANGA